MELSVNAPDGSVPRRASTASSSPAHWALLDLNDKHTITTQPQTQTHNHKSHNHKHTITNHTTANTSTNTQPHNYKHTSTNTTTDGQSQTYNHKHTITNTQPRTQPEDPQATSRTTRLTTIATYSSNILVGITRVKYFFCDGFCFMTTTFFARRSSRRDINWPIEARGSSSYRFLILKGTLFQDLEHWICHQRNASTLVVGWYRWHWRGSPAP